MNIQNAFRKVSAEAAARLRRLELLVWLIQLFLKKIKLVLYVVVVITYMTVGLYWQNTQSSQYQKV